MTSRSMLIQVRMPLRLVQQLDRMTQEGLYASRSEAILDSVRRLVLGYERADRFRLAIIRSYTRKPGAKSINGLSEELDPREVTAAILKAYPGKTIDAILEEARR
jgi:Arc/MetJ-type ribon-helix-helix transcriptional regulator